MLIANTEVVAELRRVVNEWMVAHAGQDTIAGRMKQHSEPQKWCKPSVGFLKCNVDASINQGFCSTSFGAFLRDADGQVVYGYSGYSPEVLSPLAAEVIALRETLLWILSMQLPLKKISPFLYMI
ncbi:hypothetical protein MANES_04G048650v8 [Manihot esculenta]|uniref:Uncharacterized protein n=1 Tax=Manihot esculenta TaxID=3983 RepID=A0ACB7HXJ9_MANES|nr:hypothetical protein MANES_04G048650v8 [Manihot esculenta]